jgi:hypothetical protein
MTILREWKAQGDPIIFFEDHDGYRHIQRKRHVKKHSAWCFSNKYPKDVLLHNAAVVARGDARRFLRVRLINRIPVFYGVCQKCGTPFRIMSSNLLAGYGCLTCRGRAKPVIVAIRAAFLKRGYVLTSQRYVTAKALLRYKCPSHGKQSINWNNFKSGRGCPDCKAANATGLLSPTWKGGITPLQNQMRNHLTDWVTASIRRYGNRCILTGRTPITVHHLKSFSVLLAESMKELSIEGIRVQDVTGTQMRKLKQLLHKKHMDVLGVPLHPDTHQSFHRRYGKGCNTREQFTSFARRYPRHAQFRVLDY